MAELEVFKHSYKTKVCLVLKVSMQMENFIFLFILFSKSNF